MARFAASRLGIEKSAFQGSSALDRLVSFLLDTNVVSEWTKPRPNPGVVEWLAEINEDEVFLSVVTFAELRHGIERLAPSARRRRLDEWLSNDLQLRFEARIIGVDGAIADEWGRLVARCEARGEPLHAMDAHCGYRASSWAHAGNAERGGLSDLCEVRSQPVDIAVAPRGIARRIEPNCATPRRMARTSVAAGYNTMAGGSTRSITKRESGAA